MNYRIVILKSTMKIIEHEGFRDKPYLCTVGKLTIGYGRNLEDKGLSEEESLSLLTNDIKIAILDLFSIFNKFDTFSENRKVALVDMMYQLGDGRFNGFKKMIEAIKKEDWGEASKQCLDSTYAKQVPKRANWVAKMLKEG